MRAHKAIWKPRINYPVQRAPIGENGRKGGEVCPQMLHIEMEVNIEAK
jgi:hypothetical protein